MPQVPEKLIRDVVTFVEKTSELLEKKATEEHAVAEKAPQVIDALIKAGMINPAQREDAIAKAQNPVRALDSLQKTAEWIRTQKSPPATTSMGKAAELNPIAGSTKQASVQKESDRVWREGFGLPSR